MMDDEQKFWDAAYIAIVGGNESADPADMRTLESAAAEARKMVDIRRKFLEADTQDQFRGVTKKVEVQDAGHFDGALVERLAKSGSPDWEFLPDYMQERRRRHVRAVLAELASMPCELPTDDDIMRIMIGSDEFDELAPEDRLDQRAIDISAILRRNIAPILAAQKASLAHYRRSFEVKQARVAELEAVANQSAQQYAQALARIAELDREIDTEREKRRMSIESHKCDKASWMERVTELETRIVELTVPVVVDGKTPGQIFAAEFLTDGAAAIPKLGNETLAKMEIGARAVLRTFGNGADRIRELELRLETIGKFPGVKEALQKVRGRIVRMGFGEAEASFREDAIGAIDTEIADIEGVKP